MSQINDMRKLCGDVSSVCPLPNLQLEKGKSRRRSRSNQRGEADNIGDNVRDRGSSSVAA